MLKSPLVDDRRNKLSQKPKKSKKKFQRRINNFIFNLSPTHYEYSWSNFCKIFVLSHILKIVTRGKRRKALYQRGGYGFRVSNEYRALTRNSSDFNGLSGPYLQLKKNNPLHAI